MGIRCDDAALWADRDTREAEPSDEELERRLQLSILYVHHGKMRDQIVDLVGRLMHEYALPKTPAWIDYMLNASGWKTIFACEQEYLDE